MAVELGTAYVSITASAKGIGRSIQSELEGPLTAGATSAGAKASKGFGGAFSRGVKAIPFDKFLAVGAVAAGVKFAIGAASSLQESLSKTDAVFRTNAAEVKRWADTAATSFGQSKQQALEAASTFGNLFQAFGVGLEPATEMSTTLTRLASDLASFNNTSVEEAIEALRSGLSGETEPLKRYGVALTDARLKQEALGLGLISDVKGPLDAATKSQAAYALIMKDTSLAQGDFARTSDGFANTMRTLKATATDAAAVLGEELLPPLAKLAELAAKGITIVVNIKKGTIDIPLLPGGAEDFLSGLFQDAPTLIEGLWEGISTGKPPWELEAWGASAEEEADKISNAFVGPQITLTDYFFTLVEKSRISSEAANASRRMSSADALVRDETMRVVDALHAHNEALQQSINLQLAAIGSAFGVSESYRQFQQAAQDAATATDDSSTAVNEQQAAYDAATQAAIANASATVEYAKKQAEATGKTITAKQEQELLIGTLMELASQASGPVAASIGDVITQLQTLDKTNADPEATVTDHASPKIATIKLNLADLNGRSASVSINALTGGAENAIQRVHDAINRLPKNFGLGGNFDTNASGVRNYRGGWTWVGEEGPELVRLPRGSDVFSAAQSAAMMGGGSVASPAAPVLVAGNTFIGSGPEVVKMLNAKIAEARQAAVRLTV